MLGVVTAIRQVRSRGADLELERSGFGLGQANAGELNAERPSHDIRRLGERSFRIEGLELRRAHLRDELPGLFVDPLCRRFRGWVGRLRLQLEIEPAKK